MRTTSPGWLLVALVAVSLPGCGDGGPPAGAPSPVASVSAPTNAGDASDASVKALIAGLKQGRPEAFWEFLPADFQEDLNGLIHLFAERMDPDLWDRTVSLFRKLAGVLKTQKRFLAAGGPAASQAIGRPKGTGPDAEPTQGKADWAKLADMLETVLDSDLASLQRLKSADGGKLLATAGGKVIEQLKTLSRMSPDDDFAFSLERLAELQVSVVHATNEAATLKFEAPGDTPLIVKFARHKGKWIPEDLENEWPHRIGNARAWLATTLNPETFGEQKPRFLNMLGAADAALDKMAAAQTLPEFAVAGQQATFTLLSLFALLSGPPPEAETPAVESQPVNSKELVTVIVSGMLDDDAQDSLRARIKGVADDPDRAAAEITGDDETSTFKVGPVADVEAFAKKLDFLDVVSVDAATRTITAKPRK